MIEYLMIIFWSANWLTYFSFSLDKVYVHSNKSKC